MSSNKNADDKAQNTPSSAMTVTTGDSSSTTSMSSGSSMFTSNGPVIDLTSPTEKSAAGPSLTHASEGIIDLVSESDSKSSHMPVSGQPIILASSMQMSSVQSSNDSVPNTSSADNVQANEINNALQGNLRVSNKLDNSL